MPFIEKKFVENSNINFQTLDIVNSLPKIDFGILPTEND